MGALSNDMPLDLSANHHFRGKNRDRTDAVWLKRLLTIINITGSWCGIGRGNHAAGIGMGHPAGNEKAHRCSGGPFSLLLHEAR
jgi:hypothetical protein